jgi:3-dehydroquinate synthase
MTTPSALSSGLPPHRTVRVDLGPRSYDVLIGHRMLERLGEILRDRDYYGDFAGIIDDEFLRAWAQLRPSVEKFGLEQGQRKFFYFKIRGGEGSKTLENVSSLLSDLAKEKLARSSVLIAVGGGVIGDLAGFVAATYLRGINFVQVPTTLLAMVDSSVGGKTGVNLPEGKNLVGAFYQPKLVVADLDTLKTLPAKEFAAGMAEVIKYGAIKDKVLFDLVAKGVKPDDDNLDEIVEKCVAIKARIVENDEFETKGERALLNFGHTIGHAIENATGYKAYLHGEAISLGMRAAAWLSVWQAGLPESDARRIESALIANHLPVTLKPDVDRAAILSALGNDKKVATDGRNRWVLLRNLGIAESGFTLSPELVAKGIELLRGIPQ